MFSVTATTDHGVAIQQAAMRGGFFRSKDDVEPEGLGSSGASQCVWRERTEK